MSVFVSVLIAKSNDYCTSGKKTHICRMRAICTDECQKKQNIKKTTNTFRMYCFYWKSAGGERRGISSYSRLYSIWTNNLKLAGRSTWMCRNTSDLCKAALPCHMLELGQYIFRSCRHGIKNTWPPINITRLPATTLIRRRSYLLCTLLLCLHRRPSPPLPK